MPIDLPDWGPSTGGGPIHQLEDVGELAVRLGSIVSFDRRGDVIWLDDFECGITKWTLLGYGLDNVQEVSADRARNGEYSAHLVAGKDVAGYALMQHVNPYPQLSSFGCEFSFSLATDTNTLEFRLSISDGSNALLAYILWDFDAKTLQYRNESGGYTILATGVDLRQNATLFHTLKVVADAVNKKYIRCIIDGSEYLLTDITLQETPSGLDPSVTVTVNLLERVGINAGVYVDDVILTQNEPPNP